MLTLDQQGHNKQGFLRIIVCLLRHMSCIDDVSEIWSDCCDTVAFQSNTFEVRNWAPEKNWGSKNATATAFTIAWPHDK